MAFPRKKVVPAVMALILAVAAGSVLMRSGGKKDEGTVRVWGNIEATTVEISFKVAGRVAARPVNEGDRVKAGQLVARLDDADLAHSVSIREADKRTAEAALAVLLAGSRPEEIAQAKAEVDRLSAFLAELKAGPRPQELKAAAAQKAAAEAEAERTRFLAERAKTELLRMESLYKSQFISASDLDNARTARDAALAANESAGQQVAVADARLALLGAGTRSEELQQAGAALKQAEERYALAVKGPRREEIEGARARVAAAEAALEQARTQLGYAEALSPLDGVCLTKAVEPGEFVNPGTPVATVADLKEVWLRGYVDETDLGRVKLGMEVAVSTDSYPGKTYKGNISFIASEAEFTPRSVQTEKERVRLVYRVKIALENPAMELKPGMPADGLVNTGK